MIMNRVIFLLICICLSFYSAKCQDIHFSQFYNTPTYLNPGATGVTDGYERVVLNHKRQWGAIGNPFVTTAFSFDMPLLKGNSKRAYLGVGLNAFKDNSVNVMGQSQAGILISGIVNISKTSKLSLGAQLSYGQRTLKSSSFVWESQFVGDGFDSGLPTNEGELTDASFFYLDYTTGVYYSFNGSQPFTNRRLKIETGVAYHHFTRPELTYYTEEKLHSKYVFNFSGLIDLIENQLSVQPSIMLMLQGGGMEINLGSLVRYQLQGSSLYTGAQSEMAIGAGLFYRYQDAFIPTVTYQYSFFTLGISYDVNISSLRYVSRGVGGLELGLKYISKINSIYKRRNSPIRFIH